MPFTSHTSPVIVAMAAVPSLKKSCAVMKNSVPYGFSNGIVMRSVAKGVCVPSSPLVSIHCGHWLGPPLV